MGGLYWSLQSRLVAWESVGKAEELRVRLAGPVIGTLECYRFQVFRIAKILFCHVPAFTCVSETR